MSKKVTVELFMVDGQVFDSIATATGYAETVADVRQVSKKIGRARIEIDTDQFKRYTTIQPCEMAAQFVSEASEGR